MPIISIDGPSAVGKTSTCRLLAQRYNAWHIPEVNHFFIRNREHEPEDWYFQRNIDRWLLAEGHSRYHDLVIIDVDTVQPLYYNWAFHFKNLQSLEFMNSFYRRHIQNGTFSFPDRYIYLYVESLAELQRRKEGDKTRLRGGFETNMRLVSGTRPQTRYFEALNNFFPGYVTFVEASNILHNVEQILVSVRQPLQFDARARSLEILDTMIRWISHNEP